LASLAIFGSPVDVIRSYFAILNASLIFYRILVAEEQEFPLVWRRDRVPTLTVRADVNRGVLPDIVVQALAPKVAEFSAKLPSPYKLETGGLFEESQISQGSVFAVIPLMIVLMLLAILTMYLVTGTMDMRVMIEHQFVRDMQIWLWIAFFMAFAVKTPIWPS
jgi:hypothetical protein